jgi:hypothetical protein
MGGAVASKTGTLKVQNSTFTGNSGGSGGAIWSDIASAASVSGCTLQDNHVVNCGGALCATGPLTLDRSRLSDNRASFGGAVGATGPFTATNSLLADNYAVSRGAAMCLTLSQARDELRFVTIASKKAGAGSAIFANAGSLNVVNSIVYNYTIGISVTATTLVQDYNLLTNQINVYSKNSMVTNGSHSIYLKDPLFVRPGTGDYHLLPQSPAVNSGTDAGVAVDIDGEARPQGPGFDMGMDEVRYWSLTYLPNLKR